MIPKHANPLLLPDQTVVVSRAALRDSDEEGENDGDGADPERAQMLARLENILKRSIAAVLPSESSHAACGDEERPRKKKRRKTEPSKDEEREGEGEGEGEEPVAVPFRLLSGVTQPKPIVLAPKPPPVYKSIRPLREDTEAEAARRAARAREVAVGFAWVMKESSRPYMPLPNAAKKERTVTAHLPPASPPPLLLLEVSKPAPKPPHPARLDPTIPVEPSPHAHETSPSCCPIVPASPGPSPATSSPSSVTAAADSEPQERKRKRRRNKANAEKPPVQPAFWRPREGMGGKSAGYALGYPGWPLREGDVPRYHRDTMRKAVFVFDA
ncbi:hypothetical protein PYCCODRAFT_736281 [Trametes coccinea BRFM310]|uniref:Uncharacterized protein n=1 Tax=Trametes coccinea (strain BRFM310) TaxID=1353009 RepID=A0A1Y2IFK6_TRAC3|nr:hypothetical protein PYCCODRAFT_736281 [Trametes coccinea BRFM310]